MLKQMKEILFIPVLLLFDELNFPLQFNSSGPDVINQYNNSSNCSHAHHSSNDQSDYGFGPVMVTVCRKKWVLV